MTFEMNKDKVVEAPKDTILDGIITEIEETTWRDLVVDAEKLAKFKEPDQKILNIRFEYGFKDAVLNGSDTAKYHEKPSAHSKLGKILVKYETLKVGTKISVDIDGDGFSSIRIK